MKLRSNLINILLLFVTCSTAVAQQRTLDTVTTRFKEFRKNNYQEKIYLHTDQSAYLTGEIVWFSAYLVDGTFHKFSDLSKVAYIEIVDTQDKPVLQAKIEMTSGKGSGSLYLPPTIHSGNYVIRAYTNWMKNSPAEFYFHKPVTIINTFEPLDPKKTAGEAPAYDAQFFPEGGNLVAGLQGKVGFRVVDKNGKGISFRGSLINSSGDTILHFSPLKFGIGNFIFQPAESTTYTAVLEDELGKVHRYHLPEVIASGYALKVDDSAQYFNIHIQSRQTVKTSVPVYIFVHARQQIALADVRHVGDTPVTLQIDKNNLPEGISHITLFDQNLQPVSERLVFRQPVNKLSIQSKADQGEYGVRRPVNINLSVVAAAKTKSSHLSVAVYKQDSVTNSSSSSILDYLWLSSDLKGIIESPEYYLSSNSPEVMSAIDNLMITHGWRKFRWDNVLSGKKETVKFIPEYLGHVVTGEVHDENDKPVSGVAAYLGSPAVQPRVYLSRSNASGKVQYVLINYYGQRKLVLQTNGRTQDSVYKVRIDNPFSLSYSSNRLQQLELSPSIASALLNRSLAMQVSDVFHREHQEKFLPVAKDTSAFFGKADESYRLDDYTRFPVMEEVMREYVPGVVVRKRKDGFHFMVLDDVNKSMFSISETPLMLIDGVPFFDEDEIMTFDPLKIEHLYVMRRRYYIGAQSFPGVVSYSTYLGDLAGFKINPRNVVMDYEGLQQQREFYSPRYENEKQRDSRIPDQRYLLYWNPSVTTDADGKAQVSFYTSDVSGNYRVVVEGVDGSGAAGQATSSFNVRAFNN